MSRVQYSVEQLKKLGLVEKDGQYVPVKSLVANGKVKKIDIDEAMGAIMPQLIKDGFIDPLKQNRVIDFKICCPKGNEKEEEAPYLGLRYNQSPRKEFKIYNETGLIFFKPNPIEQFLLPNGSYIDVFYKFNLPPIPAPRMTQSDKWKTDPYHTDPSKRQRKPVAQYFAFRDKLLSLCKENGYKLTNTLNILFVVPFPKSYSKNKCEQLNNQPHDQKPDLDNFCKCWMDSLSNNDCKVWNIKAIKLWGYTGQIIIF